MQPCRTLHDFLPGFWPLAFRPERARGRKDGREPDRPPSRARRTRTAPRIAGRARLRLPGRRRMGQAPHRGRREDHRPAGHRREPGARRPRPVAARPARRFGTDAVRHGARAPGRRRGPDRRRHRGRRKTPGRTRHRAPRRAGPNARPPHGGRLRRARRGGDPRPRQAGRRGGFSLSVSPRWGGLATASGALLHGPLGGGLRSGGPEADRWTFDVHANYGVSLPGGLKLDLRGSYGSVVREPSLTLSVAMPEKSRGDAES